MTRWTVIHLATGAAAEVAAAATAPHAARRSRLPLDRDGAIERIGLRQERGAVIGDESNVPVLHPA